MLHCKLFYQRRGEIETLREQVLVVASQQEPNWELVSERVVSELERAIENRASASIAQSSAQLLASPGAAVQTATETCARPPKF